MTPKEKADSIFQQMYKILWHTNSDPIHCKQCALIAVDELIEQQEKYNNGSFYPSNYWNKVKEQIVRELEMIKRHRADVDGKLMVTPKDVIKNREGISPDVADAIMMRMYFELNPSYGQYVVG